MKPYIIPASGGWVYLKGFTIEAAISNYISKPIKQWDIILHDPKDIMSSPNGMPFRKIFFQQAYYWLRVEARIIPLEEYDETL